jgi:hypothetical protein
MPFPAKEKITCYCLNCGNSFKVSPWKKGKAKFCNNKCKYEYIKKRMLYLHSLKRKIRIPLHCQNIYCNTIFYVIPSKAKVRKFCGRKCYEISKTLEYKEELARRMEINTQQNFIKQFLSLNK